MKMLYEAIEEWMVKFKKNSVKPSTYDRMVTALNLTKNYTIAYVRIDVLCSADIQDYLNKLIADKYALTTIKKQYNLLTGFIKYANAEGLMPRPIYHNVKIPSQSVVIKQKKEVVAYDEDQQVRIRSVLETHNEPEYDVALFMLETGARIGEALAVYWSDIDWRRRAVRINKTFVRLGNSKKQYIQNSAKSFTSNRIIPLSTKALALLKDMYEKREDIDCPYVFQRNSKALSYESMRWHIRKACNSVGVPYLGQHVFRHTFATNCYYHGCDVKILSKLLGHSDIAVTYNTYIHLFGDTLEELRKAFG